MNEQLDESTRTWMKQVRVEHGDVEFAHKKAGSVHTVIARNKRGDIVASHDKNSGRETIFSKQNEEILDEAHKLNDKVIMSYPSLKGVKGTIGEIRHGAYKGAPKTYTIDYQHPNHSAQNTSSIQLSSSQFKAHKEGTLGEEVKSVDEATMSYQDWKKKLPNDISYIDSTEEKDKSHAYKMVHTPDGKRKYKIGTYYHNSNYGDMHEEVESLDELSMDTVKSYKAKVATNPVPSKTTSDLLHKAIRRFAGKERAEDRIHHDEMVKMRARLGIKEETLDEMAMSIKKNSKGQKVEWHNIGDNKHMVSVGDQPAHTGFLSHTDAAKLHAKLVREEVLDESDTPDRMKGKQKPYVSSDGKGNYEVLGNTGQTKATFSRATHGKDAHTAAQKHLRSKYSEYMKEEVLDEAAVPSHKVGDTVYATSPTNKALTMTGKVTKVGASLTTVKHKDGSEANYPHKLVASEYSDLHKDPAKKYKQFQREHLEQTGELLTLTEVKYMVENANGGAGAIAQHGGIDGQAPANTGKAKKMMGNKASVDAIVKIIAKGAKPN